MYPTRVILILMDEKVPRLSYIRHWGFFHPELVRDVIGHVGENFILIDGPDVAGGIPVNIADRGGHKVGGIDLIERRSRTARGKRPHAGFPDFIIIALG